MAKRGRKTVPKERLSRSEWEIMRICWRLGRCTVRQVLEEDLETHTRDYRTILTFMTRMTKKGWLKAVKDGNINHYTPAIAEDRALTQEIRWFLGYVVGPEPQHRSLLQTALDEQNQAGTGRGP